MLRRRPSHKIKGCTGGAFIVVDDRGFIREVLIIADDERQQAIVEGALARVAQPKAWGWLRRLIGKRSN